MCSMPDIPSVLDKFFEPKSVAAIGASATPGKPGNVLLKNIRDNGFERPVYPVNPRGGTIEGYKVFTSIDQLPEGIDQAVVTLPAAQTPSVVRALAAKGVEADDSPSVVRGLEDGRELGPAEEARPVKYAGVDDDPWDLDDLAEDVAARQEP